MSAIRFAEKRPPLLREGAVLDDRYTLLKQLGEGGQGSMWQAFDRNTGEDRALKIAWLDDGDPEAADRVRREAELVKGARHPALVTCHSLFQIPSDDLFVLVFELVRATSMAKALDDPRFDRPRKLAALRHIAAALAYLHRIGVVHRDLKPDNVLVTPVFWDDPAAPSGIKLIDFGIAAPRRAPDGATIAGMFGTPPYMAPELFASAALDAQRSTARDVFAFGVIGWEMLEGAHPTGLGLKAGAAAYRADYERRRRSGERWPSRAIEGPWGAALAACLALDPAERPRDGSAILSLLDGAPRALAKENGSAEEPAPPNARRSKVVTDPHVAPDEVEPERAESGARTPLLPRSPTLPTAPASAAVRTEIAPASSLPRPSAVDRTTPMVPEVSMPEAARRSAPSTAPEIERPGSQRRAPAPDQEEPALEARPHWSASRVAALVLAVAIGATVAGTAAWMWLHPDDAPTSAPVSTGTSRTLLVPPRLSTTGPTASATATATTSATATAEATSTATSDPPAASIIVCCDEKAEKKHMCASGQACKTEGCTKEVPEKTNFVLRLIGVRRRTEIYTRDENLADGNKYPDSEVCIQAQGGKDCASMKDIASKEGARLGKLLVSTSDIRDKGFELSITQKGRKTIRASLGPTHRLQSTAMCQSLPLMDEAKGILLDVHLDDPHQAAGSKQAP